MAAARPSGTPSVTPREDAGGRHRRCRGRPLPPARRRPRPDAATGARGLPLFDRVDAHPGHRKGEAKRARPEFLLPPGRRTARPRHPTDRHALSLGPSAGARGCRRLAGAGHRAAVRRIRLDHGRGARRSRRGLDDDERTVVLGVSRLRIRGTRARSHERRVGPSRASPPESRARPRNSGASPRRQEARRAVLDHPELSRPSR